MDRVWLLLNRTFVLWQVNVPPAHDDSVATPFTGYGSLECTNISVGQTYIALFAGQFADSVSLNETAAVQVSPYPIPGPYQV